MGLLTAIVLMSLSFLTYIILRSTNYILADIYLFILFIFAFVISNREFSVFYLLLFIIAIVIDLAVPKFKMIAKSTSFISILISLAVGLGSYLFISFISAQVGGNIIGAPEIAIVSSSSLAQNLRPTFISMLGIIENRIAFAFFEVLNIFGLLIPFIGVAFELVPYVVPVLVVSLIMALFHITAYSVSVSLMWWAMIAFVLFLTSYITTGRDSLSADTAHFLNNGIIDVNRGLALVI